MLSHTAPAPCTTFADVVLILKQKIMSVSVVRYQRKKRIGDASSPNIYVLKQKPGTSKVHTIEMIASDIETIGSLSQEDVTHVMKAFVRRMKKVLVEGNRVKVDGLGTFYITLKCPGVETEKDCVVKNIAKVNLRFMVDSGLRLANSSTATTRSGDNNIDFVIDSGATGTGNTGGTTPTDPTTPGGDEDDPNG